MTLRRITRNRRLAPEEAAKYREVREQVAEELPELITRHHERLVALDQLAELVQQLKAAREEKGLRGAHHTSVPDRREPGAEPGGGAGHFLQGRTLNLG